MALEFRWQDCPPEKLLEVRFGITTGFHPGQRDIIKALVQGKRILAIQRTGWGKSLCYQVASLYYPHLTIVFSPLKALMRDQCQRCNNVYRIPSAIVSSDFPVEANRETLAKAIAGGVKILFIAPERLDNLDWQTSVIQMRISMIVIDEAHCISVWGHEFRTSYRRIVRLLNAIPQNTPVLALTATANPRVEKDILQQIGMAQIVRGTMQRPNLFLNAIKVGGEPEKLRYLAEILPQWDGTGIVYTATRNNAELVMAFLAAQDIEAVYYHAGLEDDKRQEIEQGLMQNAYKVVCSTNALGMGIDKPDIRFVIHYNIPASPIHYYQEIGRAGRDGNPAKCVLLYDPADLSIQRHFIQSAKPARQYYDSVFSHLRAEALGERDLMRRTGFSQNAVKVILADLEEQKLIERGTRDRKYTIFRDIRTLDLSVNETVRLQKERELQDMEKYAQLEGCYMAYLTAYLGDQVNYYCGTCGRCQPQNFPLIARSERIQQAVTQFLEKDFLPRIEKREGKHEAGLSLSYHSGRRIGNLVRLSKYEDGGPFPEELVLRAVQVIKERYPVNAINGIVSVPPTRSGPLVETFVRKVAAMLQISYIPVLVKVRITKEQKDFTNWVQKADNVKGAFVVTSPELIAGSTLLLIDDIYDSGYTLREIGHTLMRAGAEAVYPFTITRTVHSDDQ